MSDTDGFKLKEQTRSSGTWTFTIENFSKYNEIDQLLQSPCFGLTDGDIWYLVVYPHGTKKNNGEYMSLYICCEEVKNIVKSPSFKYKLSIISTDIASEIEMEDFYPHLCENGWGYDQFVKKAELFANKDLYLPDDILTISCKITRSSEKSFGSAQIIIPKSKHLEILQLLAEKKGFGDVVTLRFCNKQPGVIVNNSTIQSSNSTKSANELSPKKEKINEEINENANDVLEARDFQIYKGILTSHSPVFEAMFEHKETKENQENLIEINDVDPQVGDDMLHFLYYDELRVSENNLIDLLAAADKYELIRFKALCEEALLKALTKENSLITLGSADFYNSDQLKDATIDFIVEHIDDIIESNEYNLFKKDNAALALEIFEKAHYKNK